MKFTPLHHNHNVTDLKKSMAFYEQALGLTEVRRLEAEDGSYTIVFLGCPDCDMQVELTAVQAHPHPYGLGENEQHIGFRTDDYEAAHALHEKMGCICHENKELGVYFIADPDGYWLEIIPAR